MNEKNHTSRRGFESQTPDNAGDRDYNEGSLWNSPIGRRVFLKKTGAATVATAVALHGFRVQVLTQTTGLLWTLKCTKDPYYGDGTQIDPNTLYPDWRTDGLESGAVTGIDPRNMELIKDYGPAEYLRMQACGPFVGDRGPTLSAAVQLKYFNHNIPKTPTTFR